MRTRLMRRLPDDLTRQAGEVFLRWLEETWEQDTRRVVAIFGEERYRLAGILAGTVAYRNTRKTRRSQTCVYLADTFSTPFQVFRKTFYRQLPAPHHKARTFLREVVWERAWTRLGTTNEILVLDLSESLWPNRLGMIVETLRGRGFVFLLFPSRDVWLSRVLKNHEHVTSFPHRPEDAPRVFERFFLTRLQSPGVMEIHLEEGWFAYEDPAPPPPRSPLNHPLAATPDQRAALDALLDFLEGGERHALLLADRGRGKSYVLGLALGLFGARRNLQVGVVIPNEEGLTSLLAGLSRASRHAKIPFRREEKRFEAGYLRGWIRTPAEALPPGLDLLVVDEAAGIPLPHLERLAHQAPRTVFATTVHGYEGTGRGFSLRFRRFLEAEGARVVELSAPIRYAPGDPVEAWLYRTLLLDAEPEPLEETSSRRVERLDRETLFLNPREEATLRSFVGIYVHAHYRNEPNDLLLLADAPHVEAWALRVGRSVGGALEVAREGGLPEDLMAELLTDYGAHERLQGHILPALMIRYYGEVEIPRHPGVRVVRIAVHPDHFGKGLGSALLRGFLEQASGYAWVGTSFGLTPELARFWHHQGFLPFHIAPGRNARSGEYSSAWIRPLREDLVPRVRAMGKVLRRRFVELLDRTYRDMEGELVLELLRALPPVEARLEVPPDARFRVRLFQNRLLPWGMVWDVARAVAIRHFLHPEEDLSPHEELLVLENFLRGNQRVVEHLASTTGDTPRWWKIRSHELFNRLLARYGF